MCEPLQGKRRYYLAAVPIYHESDIKSAVAFYKKYANFKGNILMHDAKSEFQPYMKLLKDYPEIAKKWYDSELDYDEWLFDYTFKDVIK